MATPFSILACKIPWTEESGRLQSTGLQRVRQDLATEHTYMETQKTLNSQSNLEKEGQSWRCYTP